MVLGGIDPGSGPEADRLLAVCVRDLADDGVGAHLVDLHGLKALVDAKLVEATDVFDARAVWARDAARNGPGWVAARTGASYGAAKADQHLARDLRAMPATAAAFGRTLSREQARLLAKARVPELAEAYDACEPILIEQVAAMTVAAAGRFLRRWSAEVRERFGIGEPDGSEPPAAGKGSKVHLSQVGDGWRLDGDLSGEDGEIVRNVVDAQVDQMWTDGVFSNDDGLTASERFATALVEVLVRGSKGGDDDGTARPLLVGLVHIDTDGCDSPATDGVRSAPAPPGSDGAGPTPPVAPTARDTEVTTTRPCDGAFDSVPIWDDLIGDVDDDRLTDRPLLDDTAAFASTPSGAASGRTPHGLFGLTELEHAGLVHPSQTDRWICEGTLQILHMDEEHDELRLGRKVRLATRAQRRALRARDGGCVFPGCSVAASYCIAHHVRWWEWNGTTDIENLARRQGAPQPA